MHKQVHPTLLHTLLCVLSAGKYFCKCPESHFQQSPQMPGHHSSLGLTYARPNRIGMRWKLCPCLLPVGPTNAIFKLFCKKERQNLSIAARHLGLSAHPAPGGLEAATSQSWERFRTSCCPKAPGGPPDPVDVHGERAPKALLDRSISVCIHK